MTFTDRQALALAHPLTAGDPRELAPLTRRRDHARGLLTTILAVDR